MSNQTFAIIGAGAGGIACGFYLSKATNPGKIILLEASHRIGGWIQSTTDPDGPIFDVGPRSMRTAGFSGRNTLHLADQLRLTDDILPITRSHTAAAKRFIYANDKLCTLPNSFPGIIRKQSPFSQSLIRQCWKEPFRPKQLLQDESIYSFFQRRLSPEVAQYLSDPLCRGIFAGNAKTLSMKACFKVVFEWEQKYGSIIRGALRHKPVGPVIESPLITRQKLERWSMWSLRQGLQQLTDTLEQELSKNTNVQIKKNDPCTGLTFQPDGTVLVQTPSEKIIADHVFSCIQAKALGSLLTTSHPQLAQDLAKIPTVHVIVVNLEFPGSVLPVQGFGHLIPSSESSHLLGVIYDSCIFPQHNRPGPVSTRLTCMMGGAWFDQLFGNIEAVSLTSVEDIAIEEVRRQLGISQVPSYCRVNIHKNCIPQYQLGHCELVENLEEYIVKQKLPISLLGASYKGPSVNDCMYNARLEVERILQSYGQSLTFDNTS